MRDQGVADILVAAIRKPLDALDGAAEEAANGMLGRAKLGLLVAANGLIAALNAVDAEFARQYGTSAAGARRLHPERHGSDNPWVCGEPDGDSALKEHGAPTLEVSEDS